MRKVATFIASAFVVTTLSSRALAQEPAPSPAPPPPQKDVPAAQPAQPAPGGEKVTGVSFDLGFGMMALGGHIARSVDLTSLQSTFAVKLTVYPTQHVGVSAALEAGAGKMSDGFDNALSVRVPVRVEYAMQDRARGAYFDGGLMFVNLLAASTGDSSSGKDPATIVVTSPVDYSVGVGYRIPFQSASLDLRAGIDWGQYTHLKVDAAGAHAEGDIDPSMQAMHYALNLGVAYRFR